MRLMPKFLCYISRVARAYRRWIRESENGRSLGFYYLGKALIQELGEDKGTALIVKQIEEMGSKTGKAMREADESQGSDNSLKNYARGMDVGTVVYNFAWVSSTKKSTSDERVREFSYCPIADGFKKFGEEGVKIGELFCNHIDNADIQGYNPEYECKRISSLNLNGLCRLHFKKK
jgi:hypothetical protein